MKITFVRGKYWKIILYKRSNDTIELWIKFENIKDRERFDKEIIEYIDKGWYIKEVKRDNGVSLFIILEKIKIKSLFV